MVPRRITFLAKSEYFTERGIKGRLKKVVLQWRRTGADRPQRRQGVRGRAATGIRILDDGKLLGIYPEGTRSPDGRLYRGKIGVARMALEAHGCRSSRSR